MQNIVAPFRIGIESWEQGIQSELPFSLRKSFVLKVVLLELGANVNSGLKFLTNLPNFFRAVQSRSNGIAVDVLTSSGNDFVASFLDQNDQSGWSVVKSAERVNFQEGMHNGSKKLMEVLELLSVVAELSK